LKGSPDTHPEIWYRRKDGSEFWASIFVSPVYDQSGAVVQHYVSLIDLTKHKHAAAQLEQKSSTLEAALETMDQGLIMIDSDGIVQVCNHRAIEMLDLPPDYCHSKPSYADFIAHQFSMGEFAVQSEGWPPWLTSHRDFHSAPPLYERTRPNGTILEVRTVCRPDGMTVRTFNDITARREAEERLRQSQKMEAIGQLTGGIAHDFNNMLTVILGNAEILAAETADPELQALARMIEETALRAAELTQQLLTFGRRQSLKLAGGAQHRGSAPAHPRGAHRDPHRSPCRASGCACRPDAP
jgi:PAS domain-containing protein